MTSTLRGKDRDEYLSQVDALIRNYPEKTSSVLLRQKLDDLKQFAFYETDDVYKLKFMKMARKCDRATRNPAHFGQTFEGSDED